MNDSGSRLQIIFPDFFNLVAEQDPKTIGDKFPGLVRLLDRGKISEDPNHTLTHEMLSIFGWNDSSRVLPNLTAPSAEFDGIKYSHGLYRADPVHLRADGMQLRLFSGKHVAPNADEADKLIKELNLYFPDCEFCRGRDASRWYIRFAEPLNFDARTPFQMHQQIIDDELPTGRDAKKIHTLLNEFQMMMHQSEVNQLREAAGKPVLNSVWIWGGGEQFASQAGHHIRLYGGDFLTRALANQCGINSQATPYAIEEVDGLSDPYHKVIFLNDPTESLTAESKPLELDELERNWCKPLVNTLKRGKLKQLQIVDNYRRLEVSHLDVWKFWRKTTYFSDRLSIDVDPQKISSDVSPHDPNN